MIGFRVALSVVGSLCITALFVLAGCGDDEAKDGVPSGNVARVGDTLIPRSVYDADYAAGLRQVQAKGGMTYDPPRFARCIAAKRAQPTARAPPPSAERLRDQCRRDLKRFKSATMQDVLEREWVKQEAERKGIKVSRATLDKRLKQIRTASFRTEAEYKRALETTGATQGLLRAQLLQALTVEALRKRAKAEAPPVSAEAVRPYYYTHRKRYSVTPTRDFHLVLTKTREQAAQAKRALDAGESWARVAKRYSTDETADQGGHQSNFPRSGEYKQLDKVLFAAPKGAVMGPAKIELGWLVFRVDRIVNGGPIPLERVRGQIRAELQATRETEAAATFLDRFHERYRRMTVCAPEYRAPKCGKLTDGPPAL